MIKSIVIGLLAALAILLAVFAGYQRSEAERNHENAVAAKREALEMKHLLVEQQLQAEKLAKLLEHCKYEHHKR